MSKENHKLNGKFVGANCVRPHFGEIAKKQNGITLIALIITIIVMLILTGVTLSITLGDNGLVNKAKEATTQTQFAMDRELLLSAVVGAMGNDGKVNLSAINLPEGFTGSNGTYTSKNGNTFSVSENGEILYTGETGSGNGTEIENVDLIGKYYLIPNDDSFYLEIINDNTMIMAEGGEYLNAQIAIDYNNKTVTMIWEVEVFDNKINEMVMETDTMLLNYELVIENDEIVNILLIEDSNSFVFFQNQNGFKYDLNGEYADESGSKSFIFNSEKGTVTEIYLGGVESEGIYAEVNGIYFSSIGGIFKVSEDKNSVTFYTDLVYTKQSN